MVKANILAVFVVFLRIHGVVLQFLISEEGPYKAVISNISSCAQPPNWLQWNMTTYTSKNNNVVRGTVNCSRSVKDLKVSVALYYFEENKKTKVFSMKNQNCHNAIVEVILKTVRIPFNDQTCKMNSGNYTFKDLNADSIIHTVVQSLWYGTAQLTLKINERSSTCLCLDAYFQVKKL